MFWGFFCCKRHPTQKTMWWSLFALHIPKGIGKSELFSSQVYPRARPRVSSVLYVPVRGCVQPLWESPTASENQSMYMWYPWHIVGYLCRVLQFHKPERNCEAVLNHMLSIHHFNTLRPRPNEQHFADNIFKCIFFNENVWISIKISLKFVPKAPINNIPALVQIMAWRRPGDKPISEPMMVSLLTHICVTRPQWVKYNKDTDGKSYGPGYGSAQSCW